MKNNDIVNFQHINVFLSGSSAAGKTSLCNSLLGLDFVETYESSNMKTAKHAYVTNNTSVLQSKTGKKIWSVFSLEEQILFYKSLWRHRHIEQTLKNNSEQDTSSDDSEDEDFLSMFGTDIDETEDPLKEFTIQEPVKIISIIDTGGQPGYIHMLPTIIHMLPATNNCPMVNFVVIDMTKNLEDNVLVCYKDKEQNEEIKPYHLHYTNKDLIKLLMSVTNDSFNIDMPDQATPVMDPDVFIGFIGTHRDILENEGNAEKIRTLDEQLSELVQQNCQSAIIKTNLQQKYLYPVDNTTSNDTTVQCIRDKIYKLVNNIDTIPLPIKWMILELEIKLYCNTENVPYITYQRFLEFARKKSSIKEEEAKNALHYFHSHGILLHFQEVPDMWDYIIVKHQWLYDQLSMLITVSSDNPSCGDNFSRGILRKNELPKIEMGGDIKMENLISLLDYKKILAKYTKDNKDYYYLPFVLPYCQHYIDKCKFLLLEPLLVRFSSGFLPRGFFCSLVVHFLQKIPPGWKSQLQDTNKHFRNVITFLLPNNLYLRLQDKIYYLEVQIRHYQHCKGECMLKEFKILYEYLQNVCKTLGFDGTKLQFGFLCQCIKLNEEDHIVVLPSINDPLSYNPIYCEKCQNQSVLGELHKLWFKEVKVSDPWS